MITTKFITDLAITTAKLAAYAVNETKVKLSNNAFFLARNAANSADVNIMKVNASDKIEFGSVPQVTADPTVANDLARKSYVDAQVTAQKTWEMQKITLIAGDITNQYLDLAQVAVTKSIFMFVDNVWMKEGDDFTINYTGGTGGVTRITFAGDIATGGGSALVAGDVVYFKYQY